MQDKTVNIFLVTDQQNLKSLHVTLVMLLAHSRKDLPYRIFILYNEIANSDKADIEHLLNNTPHFKASFHHIHESDFITDLPSGTPHTSKVGRFKFLIGNFNLDKALYIDTDILIRADIAQLYATDLGNYTLAAVPDVNNKLFNKNLKLPKNYNYFNSGVLLMDCVKWKKQNITQRLMEVSVTREQDLIYVDQDAFNVVFAEIGYQKLPLFWNFPSAIQYFSYTIFTYIRRYRKAFSWWDVIKAFQKPLLVHFIGKPKPNDGNMETAYAEEYMRYFNLSTTYFEG